MGSGRDKRKKCKEKKEGPTVGTGAIKTERKTAKNEEKKEKRAAKKLEGDEDDLDALLERFALEDKSRKAAGPVFEADCPPPTARVNASFIPWVAPKVNEIIMFGGECADLDSNKVSMFNDLYRYNCDRDRWTRVTSPGRPAPRCAHQGVIYKNQMYIFGGEVTSPNQEKFHHFKELWRLDLNTWEWDQLPSKGGPTARSGHRVAVHKGQMLLFGGFFDNGKEVRYNNELWSLSLDEWQWTQLGPVPGKHATVGGSASWPSARGGSQMAVHGDTLFLYGGYSKTPDVSDKEIEHGHIQDDVWALDLKNMAWERVKKAGMAPRPRASFVLVAHKNRAFLFGGVSDNEAKGGEDISSEFHNDMYLFNFEKRRWFAAEIRPPKKAAGEGDGDAAMTDAQESSSTISGSSSKKGGDPGLNQTTNAQLSAGQDKSSAIYRAAVKIQAHFRGYVVRKAYKVYQMGGPISEILYSPALYGLDMSARNMPRPKGRIGAQASVVGNNLWLFGGIIELGEKEITLDDMWSLDLQKMDGWQLVKENTVGEEVFKAAAAGVDSMSEDEEEGSS